MTLSFYTINLTRGEQPLRTDQNHRPFYKASEQKENKNKTPILFPVAHKFRKMIKFFGVLPTGGSMAEISGDLDNIYLPLNCYKFVWYHSTIGGSTPKYLCMIIM